MIIAVLLQTVSLMIVKLLGLMIKGAQGKDNLMFSRSLLAPLLAASLLAFAPAPAAQAQVTYDVNAIRMELAQIQQYFNQCQSGFGQGMQDSLNNFLTTGQYNVTQLSPGCDYNTMAALNARAYQLSLMLARAEGATGQACEIMWMPGCPEPGMRKGRSLVEELMPKKE